MANLRLALGLGLLLACGTAVALAATAPVATQTPSSWCEEVLATPAEAAALKPEEVLLAVSSPRAGETLTAVDGVVSVSVDYWGPRLVPAERAQAVDDYELAYFLDSDASPYLGTLLRVPRCRPHMLVSAERHISFDHVDNGLHTLTVMLAGSNRVAVNPPVAERLTFQVK